jgi:hypothetical protein
VLAHPFEEAHPPAALALEVSAEAVAGGIGQAGELLPDHADQPARLARVDPDAVAPQNLGVDLAQARAVDQSVGDVESYGLDHVIACPAMRSPTLRSALSLLFFSAWIALLFAGLAGGGAVHLLLAVSLALFPWLAAFAPTAAEADV